MPVRARVGTESRPMLGDAIPILKNGGGTHMLRRCSLLIWLLLCIALAGPIRAQAQTAPSSSDSATPTETLVFEPYTSAGLNSDLTTSKTVLGSCAQASGIDVSRPDAWSCSVGDKVYDPCFANPAGSQLACLDLPPVSSASLSAASMMSVVIVNPAIPLDSTVANPLGLQATPFLLELTDGQFCVPEPADKRFAGTEIFGYCSFGYWMRPADISKPLWTVPVLERTATASVTQIVMIGIRRLWY